MKTPEEKKSYSRKYYGIHREKINDKKNKNRGIAGKISFTADMHMVDAVCKLSEFLDHRFRDTEKRLSPIY